MSSYDVLLQTFFRIGYLIEKPDKEHPTEIAKILHPREGNRLLVWVRTNELLIFEDNKDKNPIHISSQDIQILDYKDENGREGLSILNRASGKSYSYPDIQRGERCKNCGSINLNDEMFGQNIVLVCQDCGNRQIN